MYSLFSNPPRPLSGQIETPRFRDVQKRLVEDVEKIVQYHRHGTFFTKTDNLLVKLINQVNVPMSYDLDRYYEVAMARALPVANSLRLTSSINTGQWFNGIFYHGCQELIIAYIGDDNPNELAKDWRNLEPVKVLDCPVSNMALMLPNGKPHNIEEGIAVIGIDIPTLMVQYRGFVLAKQFQAQIGEGENLGIRDFVGKYVIPNMLYRQTDLMVHNRLINLLLGAPMGASRMRHPFFISNYSELMDRCLEEVLERIKTLRLRYRDILEQVPKVFNDYPLRMPDIAETRQVWWALFLARLKAMQFLLDVANENGRHYNQSDINALKIDLKRFNSDNVFKSVLPDALYSDVNYQLKQMLAIL